MRQCGECTLCCRLLAVESIAKPMEQWCEKCSIGQGCNIYTTRPQQCRDFTCLWLDTEAIPDELRPDRSKVVLYVAAETPNRIVAHVDPHRPHAWQEPAMRSLLEHLAFDQGYTVVIGNKNAQWWQLRRNYV